MQSGVIRHPSQRVMLFLNPFTSSALKVKYYINFIIFNYIIKYLLLLGFRIPDLKFNIFSVTRV